MEIIPAIMPKNYEDLKNKIALVRGFVRVVQIDICDGEFVKMVTWPFDEIREGMNGRFQAIMQEYEGLPFWEDVDFELDLMVVNAIEDFDTYMKLGPKRIVFHLEAMPDHEKFLEYVEGIDLFIRDNTQIGIAINSDTPIQAIFPFVPHIDFVQCMGISHIGRQGEPFDPRDLLHVHTLRKEFPELTISVDGGVNYQTAEEIVEAGADRLVVGSAIFESDDISGTIRALKSL